MFVCVEPFVFFQPVRSQLPSRGLQTPSFLSPVGWPGADQSKVSWGSEQGGKQPSNNAVKRHLYLSECSADGSLILDHTFDGQELTYFEKIVFILL